MQHPEEMNYKCNYKYNFVHLALKQRHTHYLVKFASLTTAVYNMPVLPDVHILNGKNIFWIDIYMESYNKFT